MSTEMAARVEQRAVEWLAANVAFFDPQNAERRLELLARKSLIELALLVGLRVRTDPRPLSDAYRELLEGVERVYRRASYRDLAARDPRALLLYAATHAAMRLCGREDATFHHVLRQQAAGRYAIHFERIPYRHLDLVHTLELCGIEAPLARSEAVLPLSLLAADPSIVQLSDSDLYAITHTAFYATDFGRQPRREGTTLPLGPTLDLLEGLLTVTRGRRNCDLVGELVAACACFGHVASPELERSWRLLAATQRDDGHVPGPPDVLPPDVDDLPPDVRVWATCYHTTIVAALAGLLARSAGPSHSDLSTRIAWRAADVPAADVAGALSRACRRLAAGGTLHDRIAVLHVEQRAARGLLSRHDVVALFVELETVWDGALDEPAVRGDELLVLDEAARSWQIESSGLRGFRERLAQEIARLAPDERPDPLALIASGILPSRQPSAATRLEPADFLVEPVARSAQRLATLVSLARLPVADQPAWQQVVETYAEAATAACREYRLLESAALLRGLCALGQAHHRIARDLAEYLLRQQTPEGWFGHPGIDDEAERERQQRGWTRAVVVALAELGAAWQEAANRPLRRPA